MCPWPYLHMLVKSMTARLFWAQAMVGMLANQLSWLLRARSFRFRPMRRVYPVGRRDGRD